MLDDELLGMGIQQSNRLIKSLSQGGQMPDSLHQQGLSVERRLAPGTNHLRQAPDARWFPHSGAADHRDASGSMIGLQQQRWVGMRPLVSRHVPLQSQEAEFPHLLFDTLDSLPEVSKHVEHTAITADSLPPSVGSDMGDEAPNACASSSGYERMDRHGSNFQQEPSLQTLPDAEQMKQLLMIMARDGHPAFQQYLEQMRGVSSPETAEHRLTQKQMRRAQRAERQLQRPSSQGCVPGDVPEPPHAPKHFSQRSRRGQPAPSPWPEQTVDARHFLNDAMLRNHVLFETMDSLPESWGKSSEDKESSSNPNSHPPSLESLPNIPKNVYQVHSGGPQFFENFIHPSNHPASLDSLPEVAEEYLRQATPPCSSDATLQQPRGAMSTTRSRQGRNGEHIDVGNVQTEAAAEATYGAAYEE
jgi:hypothetical protein